ncbi:MAG: Biotin/lipoate A/B protein ligase [Thermotoga sp. 50_1627]|uniref:lipoate--protein ligase family protein n=1 Tax=Pseudothermotoga sp. TaxID=2033661 RepID=UPI00076C7937|nr:MAG: Biotin/lipoate A/B protein ligase [Thermotoga sp. 50_64]KUK25301.1 MAG: Biotin/lipoate A/B protein ligase [Thermotoga sp. 50_1627]MBC7116984.1 lipoate--protein ligase family protein [Pseudothermotoga sp.]MDK2923014.1 lipoyl(octanoyl) transferase [Pseudothermotoga sp.]HBT39915.1 lipoate--protein ligase family protein [Pseudothermotoga sp.]
MFLLKTWNFPGKTNMALDVVLAESVNQPLLRLYSWARPTLSVGKHQRRIELNIEYMKEAGIECVVRPTGGRAVLHWDELTYAFMVPGSHELAKKSLEDFHRTISETIFSALRKLDLPVEMELRKKPIIRSPACFESASMYEITLNGKKLVGSAQMRTKDFVLEHGSILLRTHVEEYARCLKLDPASLRDSFVGLEEVKDVAVESLSGSLIESFGQLFGPVEHFTLNCELLTRVYEREGQFVCPVS